MGIFSKIKKNMHHGGVKVDLQAPASVSMAGGTFPIKVTVTATDAPATINKVSVELVRNAAPGAGQSTQTMVNETISSAADTHVLNLQPGQSQTVELSLAMNAGNALAKMAENPALGAVFKGLGALQEMHDIKNQNQYDYNFVATAYVEGLTLNPSASSIVQVLKPGELGGAINFKL